MQIEQEDERAARGSPSRVDSVAERADKTCRCTIPKSLWLMQLGWGPVPVTLNGSMALSCHHQLRGFPEPVYLSSQLTAVSRTTAAWDQEGANEKRSRAVLS